MRSQIADSPPAWSNRLIGELDAADQHAKELVSALTAEQLNWRPDGSAWSFWRGSAFCFGAKAQSLRTAREIPPLVRRAIL
ncbi:MAG: hypothetical protein ACHP8A_06950 [Terriglobales bacterium]